jgi:hypothetical protein
MAQIVALLRVPVAYILEIAFKPPCVNCLSFPDYIPDLCLFPALGGHDYVQTPVRITYPTSKHTFSVFEGTCEVFILMTPMDCMEFAKQESES